MRVSRVVTVTKEDVEVTYRGRHNWVSLTGTDEDTGERVTFVLSDGETIANTLDLVVRRGSAAVPVLDSQVISVTSNSEWDSPGTSPEEGS